MDHLSSSFADACIGGICVSDAGEARLQDGSCFVHALRNVQGQAVPVIRARDPRSSAQRCFLDAVEAVDS